MANRAEKIALGRKILRQFILRRRHAERSVEQRCLSNNSDTRPSSTNCNSLNLATVSSTLSPAANNNDDVPPRVFACRLPAQTSVQPVNASHLPVGSPCHGVAPSSTVLFRSSTVPPPVLLRRRSTCTSLELPRFSDDDVTGSCTCTSVSSDLMRHSVARLPRQHSHSFATCTPANQYVSPCHRGPCDETTDLSFVLVPCGLHTVYAQCACFRQESRLSDQFSGGALGIT